MGESKDKFIKALSSIFSQEAILDKLKGLLVKFVLKKLAMTVGFKAWLVATIVEEFYDDFAAPIIKVGLAKAKYKYYVVDGEAIVERLNEAEEAGDEDSYDDAIDDIYS